MTDYGHFLRISQTSIFWIQVFKNYEILAEKLQIAIMRTQIFLNGVLIGIRTLIYKPLR